MITILESPLKPDRWWFDSLSEKMKLSSFFFLAKIGFSEDLAEFDARCPDLELGEIPRKS